MQSLFRQQSPTHNVFVEARIVTDRRIDRARTLATEFHTANDEIVKNPYFSGLKCIFICGSRIAAMSASR
jgi:hypothetical protein